MVEQLLTGGDDMAWMENRGAKQEEEKGKEQDRCEADGDVDFRRLEPGARVFEIFGSQVDADFIRNRYRGFGIIHGGKCQGTPGFFAEAADVTDVIIDSTPDGAEIEGDFGPGGVPGDFWILLKDPILVLGDGRDKAQQSLEPIGLSGQAGGADG